VNRRRTTAAMRASVQHWSSQPARPGLPAASPPAHPPGTGTACTGHHRALRQQGRPATGGQRPPPPIRRHPRYPEPPGYRPVIGPGLDQASRRQPHLLTAGPLSRGQPATIGIPHDPGIASHGRSPPALNLRH